MFGSVLLFFSYLSNKLYSESISTYETDGSEINLKVESIYFWNKNGKLVVICINKKGERIQKFFTPN